MMHGHKNIEFKYRIRSIARRDERCFSCSKHPNGSRVHPASYSLYIDSSYSEVWRPPCEADHTPSTSATVKNHRSYNSTPTYAFVACLGTTLHLVWVRDGKTIINRFISGQGALYSRTTWFESRLVYEIWKREICRLQDNKKLCHETEPLRFSLRSFKFSITKLYFLYLLLGNVAAIKSCHRAKTDMNIWCA